MQTDGVTNIIKNLGPVLSVKYTYNTSATSTASATVFFNALCDNTGANNNGVNCLPVYYDYTQVSWRLSCGSEMESCCETALSLSYFATFGLADQPLAAEPYYDIPEGNAASVPAAGANALSDVLS
jgi:hypothetical protein